MSTRFKTILIWIFRAILALGFFLASLGKLSNNPQVIDMFRDWGFPNGFYLLIGILELAGAILLLIPKLSRYAAIGLFIIMIGALVTHALHDPMVQMIRPIVFMLFIGALFLLDRPFSKTS